jgi:hypothetical protein
VPVSMPADFFEISKVWESLEMVQRYDRSVTFEDSLKSYKAPPGWVRQRQ